MEDLLQKIFFSILKVQKPESYQNDVFNNLIFLFWNL